MSCGLFIRIAPLMVVTTVGSGVAAVNGAQSCGFSQQGADFGRKKPETGLVAGAGGLKTEFEQENTGQESRADARRAQRGESMSKVREGEVVGPEI